MERSSFTVADIMRRRPVCVAPEATLRDLVGLLVRRGISGCPVVDADGTAVGTVSTTDLLWLSDSLVPLSPKSPQWQDRARTILDGQTVRDIMTPDVFGVRPEEGLEALSLFFSKTGLHRALVLDDGDLVGVVSISDLLEWIAWHG